MISCYYHTTSDYLVAPPECCLYTSVKLPWPDLCGIHNAPLKRCVAIMYYIQTI